MSLVKFGTVDYLKDQWKKLRNKYKTGDSLTRLQMKEVAQKIVNKKNKE